MTLSHREASNVDQLQAIALELVRDQAAVICGPTNAIIAARAVTATVPMVFVGGTDPVAAGLVTCFSRPGGNVTGVRLIAGNLASKQLEILHELIPAATKIGLLISPQFPDAEPQAAIVLEAVRNLGMTSVVERVIAESEFETAFAQLRQERVNALLIVVNVFFASYRDRLAELALSQNLPFISQSQNFTRSGGLASYGTSTSDVIRQAGIYVGRILKGEKPGDLPVLQPTKFELVINLKTAKAFGLTVPPTVIARADEVIE